MHRNLKITAIVLLVGFMFSAIGARRLRREYGLVMEPIINSVEPSNDPETGDWPLTLFAPTAGDIHVYEVGFPEDPIHRINDINNDTPLEITGLVIRILGAPTDSYSGDAHEATDLKPTRARFGRIDGTRNKIVSDIFKSVRVSRDGKVIVFRDGVIAPGESFTDISLSILKRGLPFEGYEEYVIVDSSYMSHNYFPGDVDGDGRLGREDLRLAIAIQKGLVSSTPCELAAGDLDGSGRIDEDDVDLLEAILDLDDEDDDDHRSRGNGQTRSRHSD